MEIPMTILRQRMIEDLQMRNLSPHTQTAYIQQVSRFARYFSKSPDRLGPEEIRTYQIYLTNERKLAPASIQIAVLSLDGTRWISCRPNFLLPVRVLSRLFRRLFLKYLEQTFDAGK